MTLVFGEREREVENRNGEMGKALVEISKRVYMKKEREMEKEGRKAKCISYQVYITCISRSLPGEIALHFLTKIKYISSHLLTKVC